MVKLFNFQNGELADATEVNHTNNFIQLRNLLAVTQVDTTNDFYTQLYPGYGNTTVGSLFGSLSYKVLVNTNTPSRRTSQVMFGKSFDEFVAGSTPPVGSMVIGSFLGSTFSTSGTTSNSNSGSIIVNDTTLGSNAFRIRTYLQLNSGTGSAVSGIVGSLKVGQSVGTPVTTYIYPGSNKNVGIEYVGSSVIYHSTNSTQQLHNVKVAVVERTTGSRIILSDRQHSFGGTGTSGTLGYVGYMDNIIVNFSNGSVLSKVFPLENYVTGVGGDGLSSPGSVSGSALFAGSWDIEIIGSSSTSAGRIGSGWNDVSINRITYVDGTSGSADVTIGPLIQSGSFGNVFFEPVGVIPNLGSWKTYFSHDNSTYSSNGSLFSRISGTGSQLYVRVAVNHPTSLRTDTTNIAVLKNIRYITDNTTVNY